MPIVFEPPQPVAPWLSYAGGEGQALLQGTPMLAHAYAQRAHMAAMGGGSDLAAQLANAQRMQQARQFADTLAERRTEFQGGLDQQTYALAVHQQMQANQQQAELIQNRQRAELSAWVQGQELTQKEQLRLQQERAAVGEVLNDPNLTSEQKQELVLQLRTGIDQKTQRLKQAQIEAMTAQKNEMVEQAKVRTALLGEQQKFDAMTLEEKTKVIFDPQALQQAMEDVRTAIPGISEADALKLAQQEVIRAGHYKQYIMTRPGVFDVAHGVGAGGAGQTPAPRGAGAGAAPRAERVPTDTQIAHDVTAHVAQVMGESKKGTPEFEEEVKKEYERRKQAQEQKAAPTAKMMPFNPFQEGSGSAEQQRDVAAVAEKWKEIQEDPALATFPEIKEGIGLLMRRGLELIGKYGSIENMPPIVRRQFEQYERDIVQLRKTGSAAWQRSGGKETPLPPRTPVITSEPASQNPIPWWKRMLEKTLPGGAGGGGGY